MGQLIFGDFYCHTEEIGAPRPEILSLLNNAKKKREEEVFARFFSRPSLLVVGHCKQIYSSCDRRGRCGKGSKTIFKVSPLSFPGILCTNGRFRFEF